VGPSGPRKPRAPKYCYDTLKVLQKVWAAWGGLCGRYLAASMPVQLDGLERHGELRFGRDRYSPAVAPIDRYLAPVKAKDHVKGKSTTEPSPLLRSSVKIQGYRRNRSCARIFRGRHGRALRSDAQSRVRPDFEPDVRAHRLGMDSHRA
jgi:hypothetical protein